MNTVRSPFSRSQVYRALREGVCAPARFLYHKCCEGRFYDQFIRNTYNRLVRLHERSFEWMDALREKRTGVRTAGIRRFDQDISKHHDSIDYYPTSYDLIPPLLDYLNLQPDDVFVDLGCGKGRVVMAAAARPLRKVIGLELVPELAAVARQNAAHPGLRAPVEIVQGDAADFDMREGTVFYFYHPFGERTLTRVMTNLRQSLREHPRAIRLVYNSPKLAGIQVGEFMAMQDWLTLETELFDAIRVWRLREVTSAQVSK